MLDDGFDDYDVTSTPFRVTVTHDEPYQFGQYVTQDVNASVHVTHLTYTPPTRKQAWDDYFAVHPPPAGVAVPAFGEAVVSVVAKVRTTLLDGSVGSFVVACFPLDSARIAALERDQQILDAAPPPAPISSLPAKTHKMQRFNELFDVVMPVCSDVAANVDIRLDVDAFVELEVEGPGQVTFAGEQCSSLIPEWMNHNMFRVREDDEELPEDEEDELSEGEMAEMYRLSR